MDNNERLVRVEAKQESLEEYYKRRDDEFRAWQKQRDEENKAWQKQHAEESKAWQKQHAEENKAWQKQHAEENRIWQEQKEAADREWRQRHDEEMKEYREDMKSLKKHIDNLIGSFAIGLVAVLIALFALFYSVISNNFVSKADYQNDQQRAVNQSKTTTVLSPP